jgi:hypothetical protein
LIALLHELQIKRSFILRWRLKHDGTNHREAPACFARDDYLRGNFVFGVDLFRPSAG